jgi:hypothetical protein
MYALNGEEVAIVAGAIADEINDARLIEETVAGEPRCARCGCSDSRSCPGGCVWAAPNLCSRCV